MRPFLSLWVLAVLTLGNVEAMAACEAASSDGRVIYGKSTPKPSSSMLVCGARAREAVRSSAHSPAKDVAKNPSVIYSDSAEGLAERVAIITLELNRSRDQLSVLQAHAKNAPVNRDAVKRLESDVGALENELDRLNGKGP